MSGLKEKVGPVAGFVAAISGKHGKDLVLWGADYSTEPEVLARLKEKCRHFIREIEKLEKRR